MKTYIYQGKVDTQLMGYDVVRPGDEVEVEYEIHNPLFIEKEKEIKEKTVKKK